MNITTFRSAAVVLVYLTLSPTFSLAGTGYIVEVRDYAYSPSHLSVQAGDTVRWIGTSYEGEFHNLVADDLSFSSSAVRPGRPFQLTFTQAGVYSYHCGLHPQEQMTGTITVVGSVETSFDIDPGLSGNWWGGPARNGEGAQIEVADGGDDTDVFVATVYSYSPAGEQIFLIAVGTPEGDTTDVDLFITEGGRWGDAFHPADIVETSWGTGTFTANSCELVHMLLTPNLAYETEGYAPIEYDLIRLTTPIVDCPYAQ